MNKRKKYNADEVVLQLQNEEYDEYSDDGDFFFSGSDDDFGVAYSSDDNEMDTSNMNHSMVNDGIIMNVGLFQCTYFLWK